MAGITAHCIEEYDLDVYSIGAPIFNNVQKSVAAVSGEEVPEAVPA